MAPIGAVLCGREPKLAEFMKANLAPKIEITHVCSSTEAALTEIPNLLQEGSANISLVIIGGLYSPEDIEKIKAAADAVKPLAFLVADRSKTPPGATGPPPPEIIKQRILAAVAATETGEAKLEPGLHKF
ncbi:uncharacterized protein A1O9_00146 [Exophiala aquamarina CBS 119918]|uniref:Uncharacterized protein n=1 Tax=Exophiala aquamarina CBS 119918 TaxID=1182545 RepID=A0A072PPY9_9EURO|nr:uncharacterized protein A1O9_00146 [Exophiala aquamarina CBS 119918]KEF62174.1 hypothetical protein A1O9_00146 [Exophiala aquamarina CBS 119918]